MFLVAFVTLVISIIGLFAQVLSLQTARLNSAQVGLMQTMIVWHDAATAFAKTNTGSITALPCRLTTTVFPGTGTATPPPVCTFGAVDAPVTPSNLPAGYQATPFTFYSLAYQDITTSPATNYVITFVHDTDSTGNIMMPDQSGKVVGYSLQDLMRQFSRALPVNLSYGSVSTSSSTGLRNLTVTMHAYGAPAVSFVYTVPSSIPAGSIALISAAQ